MAMSVRTMAVAVTIGSVIRALNRIVAKARLTTGGANRSMAALAPTAMPLARYQVR
jgi:hypothetical protein